MPECLAHAELVDLLGDAWDSLLVAGGESSALELVLPRAASADERGGSSAGNGHAVVAPTSGDGVPPDESDPVVREIFSAERVSVPTLRFGPVDAIDVLTSATHRSQHGAEMGDSILFWRSAAKLVLELLALQQFVPSIHSAGEGQYRGFWRVVVDDAATSDRLHKLIVSMPAVCRSMAADDGDGAGRQAASILEDFLWRTVDAQVRRSLEGDELAHGLRDDSGAPASAQTVWLRALVQQDPMLGGPAHWRADVHSAVREWVSRLEPEAPGRTCRTCIQLHPPELPDEVDDELDVAAEPSEPWRLTLHMQAVDDASLVVDADRLIEEASTLPQILQRPFDSGPAQLREDLAKAERFFPRLHFEADEAIPSSIPLSLEEAYAFLRDAAPMLESEGMVIWVPRWWRSSRPRLRMELNIGPAEEGASPTAANMSLDALVSFDWKVAVDDATLSEDDLRALAEAKTPLVRIQGRWTEVQSADLTKALSFLEERGSGKMTVFEALRQYYAADDLETGLPASGLNATGWVEQLLRAADTVEHYEELSQPVGFQGELRPYQLKGVAWLWFLTRLGVGACLADDMGLGKTIQLLALLLHEREIGEAKGPTLLIVPTSLVGNWHREAERFSPQLRVLVHHGLDRLSGARFAEEAGASDIVVSTYALAHRDFEELSKVSWHRIVLDEAQNIKNAAAKQSQAARKLPAIHRVAMTGTPVENRLSELWSILDFLNRDYLGSATDFRKRFAVPIERYHDTDRMTRLRELIRPFVLRRIKSDPNVEVDLPEKMEMKVFCNLTSEQAALYEAIVGEMMSQIDRSEGMQRRGLILATLVKLKQVCNHPVQFLGDGSALGDRSGKCNRLREMLEEVVAEGDRALVFTQYRQMGDLLKGMLESSLGVEPLFLHGGTPRLQRDKLIERFQSGDTKAPIFLLSLKAGGYGLNLTAASHVFHFDRWWNPAVEDQATDRAHRVGQDKRVQVHKFVCIGTLEERIDTLLEEKRALAQNIVGTGEEWLTELSTDQLRELFSLSREAVAG